MPSLADMLSALPDNPPVLRRGAEMERLVQGGRRYVGDLVGPGHLWASFVRSDAAHGRLLAVDAAAARSLEGVVGVFTAEDVGRVPRIPLRQPGPATEPYEQPVIAEDHVRYVGEPVAVVIAEDPYIAEDAAELVAIDIDPLPPAMTVDSAAGASDGRGDGSRIFADLRHTAGDVEAAFGSAATVVRGRYVLQRQTGLPLETRGLIAEWVHDGSRASLHVWGPTKYIYFTRNVLASMFDMLSEDIVVHSVDVGGMFGVRGEFYPEDFLLPWSARQIGRPVAWQEDRREHLLTTNHSREQVHDYEIAVAQDGRFIAYRDAVRIDAGAYVRPIGTRQVHVLSECLPGPYRWQAIDMRICSVATNKTPVGMMRAPLSTEATFVRERAIDRVAEELGMDPLELRRRNVLAPHDLPHTMTFDGSEPAIVTYDSGRYEATLDSLLESMEHTSLQAEVKRRRAEGEWVGIGCALFLKHSGAGRMETVRASLGVDGLLTLSTGECDIGQGLGAWVVAFTQECLGMDTAHVRLLAGDSRSDVQAPGTFGSRTTMYLANAIADALAEVRQAAVSRAARRLDVTADDVQIHPDGLAAGGDFLHWKEVGPIEAVGVHEGDQITWGFGAHLALVRVDPGTFHVQAERLGVVYDCGRVLDREGVEGQLRGGTAYGLGGALFEEIVYDDGGQPLTTNLMDYLLPSRAEMPDIPVIVVDDQRATNNPLGIRGVGEAGVLGVGAAVANAVSDAIRHTGAGPILRLPITPSRLCALLDRTG